MCVCCLWKIEIYAPTYFYFIFYPPGALGCQLWQTFHPLKDQLTLHAWNHHNPALFCVCVRDSLWTLNMCHKEAAAKTVDASCLESCPCAGACDGVFMPSVDLDRKRRTQLSAFHYRTQLSWKFSSVFPAGWRALHFWLIKVISHSGATVAVFTSSTLVSVLERSATISGLLRLLKRTFMLRFPPLDGRSSHINCIC